MENSTRPIVFRDTSLHKTDTRNRFRIPARFLKVLLGRGEQSIVMARGPNSNIKIYPSSLWETIEEKLFSKRDNRDINRLIRHWIGTSHRTDLNSTGRIKIPISLGEFSSISGNTTIAIVGIYDHFEVWSKKIYDKDEEDFFDGLRRDGLLVDELSELGI
ncbi:MAG: hypothetical protein KKA60_06915 [Proteobacteria bacterium]|nr:hypothetical protein [Pseudomonadota bacterium]